MFILRFVVLAAGVFLLGLGIAFVVTRDRRYLRIAWRTVQVVVVLAVAFGLLYVFRRVLLVL
jgi:nucleoside permease NupC